ncbi:MAG TPA: hypothetical protein EYG17_12345 [Acidimicrobiia bacterium]|nr:hypothetical protein [Acidimicrobiia bacterium]HIL06825.1 hypothetical protein [Acidimicrobiia bacterium]
MALLGSIQDEHAEISSQLQTLLDAESEASTSGASSFPSVEVQEIADQMAEACPLADPAIWGSVDDLTDSSKCVRQYLVGFPLEVARQVVHVHDKFGFFHRWHFEPGKFYCGKGFSCSEENSFSVSEAFTEEACQPIFYGYGPYPRWAIAVDTYQRVVVPLAGGGNPSNGHLVISTARTSYVQDLEQVTDLVETYANSMF